MKYSFSSNITIYVILAIIFLSMVLYTCHKSKVYEEVIASNDRIRYVDTTGYYKDQFNREHAEKTLAQGTLSSLQRTYGDLLDQKARELSTKEKEIQNLVGFNTQQKITIADLVRKVVSYDTSLRKGSEGKPDTVVIEAQVLHQNDTVYLDDSLSIAQYTKKKGWLFPSRTAFIDVMSTTGNTTIKNIQGFAVKTSESKLKIVPSASIIYYQSQLIPAAGVGVQFKLGPVPVNISVQKAF